MIEAQDREEMENPDRAWIFKKIIGHVGALFQGQPDHIGSSYNVKVLWEDGQISEEPLKIFAKDDPISCTEYAIDNDVLNNPGWKRSPHHAKKKKILIRKVQQNRMKSERNAPVFQFGVEVLGSIKHAKELDGINGNNYWMNSVKLELMQLMESNTFRDMGLGTKVPSDYT